MNTPDPLRILIVEDEVILAVELEHLIRDSGAVPVGHAMTSAEAIALAAQAHPDLALVDVHLADGPTGVEAARAMADTCGAIVLFITANLKRLPEDLAGACGVVAKPYSESGIQAAIAYVAACRAAGRACGPPPAGLTLSPDYARRWGLETAA